MLQIEELRESLIDKINHIKDRHLLEALQKLIDSTSIDFECVCYLNHKRKC